MVVQCNRNWYQSIVLVVANSNQCRISDRFRYIATKRAEICVFIFIQHIVVRRSRMGFSRYPTVQKLYKKNKNLAVANRSRVKARL